MGQLNTRFLGVCVALSMAVALVPGCGDGGVQEISEVRTVPTGPGGPAVVSDSAERFGFQRGAGTQAAAVPYTWTAPETWTSVAPTQFRPANFTLGENGEVECYLTVLGGTGGGIESNVNRWREQMSQAPYTPEEMEALPTIGVLGQEAVLVEIDGTYTGMSGTEHGENYRMLGVILEDEGQAVFVKMTGPADAVAAAKDDFTAFVQSLEKAAPGMHAHGGGEGFVHPPIGNMDAGGELSFESVGPSGLHWTAPASWQRGADRPVREVTYNIGPNGEAECYITVLPGTGGGVDLNINRWQEQMGQPELTAAELEQLPTVTIMGQPCKWVEIAGDFTDMAGQTASGYKMLGTVCLMDGQALFVKMTGPAEIVDAEKDHFLQFCESLHIDDHVA